MINTALYNKVLEAMDKGQIVVLKSMYGYDILIGTIWSADGYISGLKAGSTMNIYYEDGATNLYVPTTLTAAEPVTKPI